MISSINAKTYINLFEKYHLIFSLNLGLWDYILHSIWDYILHQIYHTNKMYSITLNRNKSHQYVYVFSHIALTADTENPLRPFRLALGKLMN